MENAVFVFCCLICGLYTGYEIRKYNDINESKKYKDLEYNRNNVFLKRIRVAFLIYTVFLLIMVLMPLTGALNVYDSSYSIFILIAISSVMIIQFLLKLSFFSNVGRKK